VAELDDEELGLVAEAWALRARTAAGEGFPYVHALVNEGREAGSSLPHSHSQLAWLREPPPAAAREASGTCGVCTVLEQANPLAKEAGVAACVHPAGRLPYECLIAPLDHGADPFGDSLGPTLRLLARTIRLLHAVEGPVPLNAWLHHGHPHIELVPRLTVLAGLELGAEIYINSLAPESAAAALRRASA
jgi:UDPglucose--hexose-1-phosphate uridylyltransferase